MENLLHRAHVHCFHSHRRCLCWRRCCQAGSSGLLFVRFSVQPRLRRAGFAGAVQAPRRQEDGVLQLSGSPFVIIKMFATVCQSMPLVAGLSKVTTSTGMKSKMILHCSGRMGKVVNLLSKLSSNWSICEYASVHGAVIFNLLIRF